MMAGKQDQVSSAAEATTLAVSRREWLDRAMRGLFAGLLGALCFGLSRRTLRNPCLRTESPCGTCVLLDRCRLPRARAEQEGNRQTQG